MTKTIKTTNNKDFFTTLYGLMKSGKNHEEPVFNKYFKLNGYNYFVVYEDSFFLVSKKEYEALNKVNY